MFVSSESGRSGRRGLLGIVVVAALLFSAAGCSAPTRGRFTIPQGSTLEINGEQMKLDENGRATTNSFGWGGAKYRVVRDGKTISEGKLDTKMRWFSLIWPPFGIIYVPKQLDEDTVYDLSKSDSDTAAR
jgi:hypothetical protein